MSVIKLSRDSEIKKRVMISLVIAISIMVLTSLYSMNHLQQVSIGSARNVLKQQIEESLQKELEITSHHLISHVVDIANDSVVRDNWRSMNLGGMSGQAEKHLPEIDSGTDICVFNFRDRQGKKIVDIRSINYRNPNDDGLLVKKSSQELIPQWGVEISLIGQAILLLSYPVYIDKRLKGYIEIGEDVGGIVSDLASMFGVELFLLINKSQVQNSLLTKLHGTWRMLNNYIVSINSMTSLPLGVFEIINDDVAMEELVGNDFSFNRQQFDVLFFDFKDWNDRVVGKLLVVRDVSDLTKSSRNYIILQIIIVVLVGLILFILFRFFIGNIEKQLLKNRDKLLYANKTVREREKRFRDIANSIADCIWEVDCDVRFTYLSDSFEHIFGYSKDEIIGKTPFDLLRPDQADDIEKKFCKIMSNKERIVDLENWNVRKDGEEICLLTNALPIFDDENKLLGYRGVDKDITQLKNIEKEREEMQLKLAESGKLSSLGQMAGGIAHEINNPLAIISGTTRRIRRLIDSESENCKKVSSYLDDIDLISERVATIVRGLRAFSRDGSQDLFEEKNIREFISEIGNLCSEKFKNFGINLSFDLESITLNQTMYCRPVQLGQVLINLLNNSFDAMGSLENTKKKWVVVQARDLSESIEISVTDSGSGIDKESVDKIMHPFYTTKPIGKGTGLGLSIARGIVESHNGSFILDVKSFNTRFVITLPKKKGRATALPQTEN